MRSILALVVASNLGCWATEDYVDKKVENAKREVVKDSLDPRDKKLQQAIHFEVARAKNEVVDALEDYSGSTNHALRETRSEVAAVKDTLATYSESTNGVLVDHALALGPLTHESLAGMTEQEKREYILKKAKEGHWALGATITDLYEKEGEIVRKLEKTGIDRLAAVNQGVTTTEDLRAVEDRLESVEESVRNADSKFLSADDAKERFAAAQGVVTELGKTVEKTNSKLNQHVRESEEKFTEVLFESRRRLPRFRIYPVTQNGRYEVQTVEDLYYTGDNIRPENFTKEHPGGPSAYRWNLTLYRLEALMHRRVAFINGCWRARLEWAPVALLDDWLEFPPGFEVYQKHIYAPGFPQPRRKLAEAVDIPPPPDPDP